MGEALALEPEQSSRLEQAFVRGCGHGLLHLGADEVGRALPLLRAKLLSRRYGQMLSGCARRGTVFYPARLVHPK